MSTLCIQAAYRVSVLELFAPSSLLSGYAKLSREEYSRIWNDIATAKKVEKESGHFVGQSQRSKCIWESLEVLANEICQKISITQRKGDISIALDDDKVWFSNTGKNL